jgi:hypothetical protein
VARRGTKIGRATFGLSGKVEGPLERFRGRAVDRFLRTWGTLVRDRAPFLTFGACA